MDNLTVGFALCGSFCTFEKAVSEINRLKDYGAEIIPIMSFNAFSTDTRFGKADYFRNKIEEICGTKIISSIADAEPIGPKKLLDVMEYDVPYTLASLMEQLGLKSKETIRRHYIHPALELNLIQMTIPDKPQSRNQRYIKR